MEYICIYCQAKTGCRFSAHKMTIILTICLIYLSTVSFLGERAEFDLSMEISTKAYAKTKITRYPWCQHSSYM